MSDQTAPVPQPTFTEAPASWNVRYQLDGFECQLTLRDMSGVDLLTKTSAALRKLIDMGAQPTGRNGNGHAPAPAPQPQAAQPASASAPAPVQTEPDQWIQVDSLAHCVTDSGHHYIKVKGGRFSKYGVKAWAEAIPAVASNWQEWEIGKEFAPVPDMVNALVSGKKVARFNSVQA